MACFQSSNGEIYCATENFGVGGVPDPTQAVEAVSMWTQWTTYAWIVFAILLFWGFCLWFFPMYSVWASRKRGEAQLAEANFAEQVAISEANARLKSAHVNREAEEIDAQAVANSVKIIGDALRRNEGYLRWQWIRMMQDREGTTVYVPTEANLPILEAMRAATTRATHEPVE